MKLRETEATLKAAQEALQAAQERADGLAASMVADHAARAGIKPEALTAAGYEAGSFFGEDGTFDPAKLTSAIHETREKFGIRNGFVPTAGTGSRPVTGTSWSDLLSEGKSRHGMR